MKPKKFNTIVSTGDDEDNASLYDLILSEQDRLLKKIRYYDRWHGGEFRLYQFVIGYGRLKLIRKAITNGG